MKKEQAHDAKVIKCKGLNSGCILYNIRKDKYIKMA